MFSFDSPTYIPEFWSGRPSIMIYRYKAAGKCAVFIFRLVAEDDVSRLL
jgi:hypothetical protein